MHMAFSARELWKGQSNYSSMISISAKIWRQQGRTYLLASWFSIHIISQPSPQQFGDDAWKQMELKLCILKETHIGVCNVAAAFKCQVYLHLFRPITVRTVTSLCTVSGCIRTAGRGTRTRHTHWDTKQLLLPMTISLISPLVSTFAPGLFQFIQELLLRRCLDAVSPSALPLSTVSAQRCIY